MKTYHMYHAETISAETKLREAERQEERVKGVSGVGGGGEPVFSLRIEERHQRRNAARKMEKMREKVGKNSPSSRSIGTEHRFHRSPSVCSEKSEVLREQTEDS